MWPFYLHFVCFDTWTCYFRSAQLLKQVTLMKFGKYALPLTKNGLPGMLHPYRFLIMTTTLRQFPPYVPELIRIMTTLESGCRPVSGMLTIMNSSAMSARGDFIPEPWHHPQNIPIHQNRLWGHLYAVRKTIQPSSPQMRLFY